MTDEKWGAGRRRSEKADGDLAPVIPLFGASRGAARHGASSDADDDATALAPSDRNRRVEFGSQVTRLHPAGGVSDGAAAGAGVTTGGDHAPGLRDGADDLPSADEQLEEVRERAESLLLRKLRSRSLSIAEARTILRGVDGSSDIVHEEIIERFVDLGYLDDAAFADQLVMSAVERRGDGRRAVAETLRKRGIPRDVADLALEAMPDDDAERALEFARSKARSVGGKDDDAALRRLAGQLARRGYPSSVALTAARTALREVGVGRSRPGPRPLPGVRFTPDD